MRTDEAVAYAKTQTSGTLAQSMAYAYNAAGQLETVTTPSGREVTFTYENNRPVSVEVDGITVLHSAVYEPFGPLGGWAWGNSSPSTPNTHTRLYDKDFRITRVTSDLPVLGTQPAFDRQFSWDDQSRITSITDLGNAGLSGSYGYDALDRLTSATQGTSSRAYAYNGVGDRVSSTAAGASTTYGYLAGTHRLRSLSGAQTKSYVFDAAGNQLSDGAANWSYGGNNRPTQAGSATLTFNALGQRMKKTVGTSVTRFVFDEAGRLWGEYDGNGALIQETIWLEDLPVATLRPNGPGVDVFYVHTDQLGTPRAVTRPSDNQIVWRWDNAEPFGDVAANEDPNGLGAFAYNLRFPGQYFDAETGTHFNLGRDYDAHIGRYIQSDPIGLSGGINTYGYVGGSPLWAIDPAGLQIVCLPPMGCVPLPPPTVPPQPSGSLNPGGSSVLPFPGTGTKDEPKSCPPEPDDPCSKEQRRLETNKKFCRALESISAAGYRACAVPINDDITQHNLFCPKNRVDKLPLPGPKGVS